MLLGTLDVSSLGNLLTGKGAIATNQGLGIYRAAKGKGAIAKSQGRGINRAGERIVRAGYGNNMDF